MDTVLGPDYHYGVLRGYLVGHGAPEEILASALALYAASGQVFEEDKAKIRIVESSPQYIPESVVEPVCGADESPIIAPAVEVKSDEAKIEAFLSARTAAKREVVLTHPSPAKKRREWSSEARAAAAERMRARQAAGKLKRLELRSQSQEESSPASASQPIIVKNAKPNEHIRTMEPSRISLAKPEPLAEPPSPHRLAISHPDWAGKREDGKLHDSDWPDVREMLSKGRSRRTIASDFDVEPETLDAFIAERQQAREAISPTGEA